ncbi:hypothetical protein EJB05_49189 [Eragrostis curvula]|uniref:Uncharacterized protein n=1 Tax=Eragrostis curvula TaxID=38414 RepID=A0A5J9T3W1_9POAL|nr:hypothetical protein EJB05_49189 [Eragrostis curvula]
MESTGAWTAPPQVPAPARRGAAAAALRGLLARAADIAVGCVMAAMWLVNATSAALVAAKRVLGKDSRAATAAEQLFVAALCAAALLLYVAAFLLLWCVSNGGRQAEAREDKFGSGGQRRRSESTGSACILDVVGPVTKHILIFLSMLILLGLLMQGLAPEKESCEGRVGLMLADIGSFHYSVMFCFVVCPKFATLLWASAP